MKKAFTLSAALLLGTSVNLSAQIILSDFESVLDGWAGTAGSTVVSTFDEGGNFVLQITDAGFGAEARATYTDVAPASGVVTVSAIKRIESEAGDLGYEGNEGGTAFVVSAGTSNNYAYSASIGTDGDNSGQAFQRVAASFTADGSEDFDALVIPSKEVGDSISFFGWDMRLDDVVITTGGTTTVLENFEGGTGGWGNTNIAPFASEFSTVANVTDGSQVLEITDTAGNGLLSSALINTAGVITTEGVHTIIVSCKAETAGTGTIDQVHIAAAIGSNPAVETISFSQSFASNTGSFVDIGVPIVSNGAVNEITLYVITDIPNDNGAGGLTAIGNTDSDIAVRIDDIRVVTNQTVPVELDQFLVD